MKKVREKKASCNFVINFPTLNHILFGPRGQISNIDINKHAYMLIYNV